jgi:hypothetical protein
MAFETSEAFYAGLSTFSTKVLERAKNNQESFNELYEDAIDAFRDTALDGAGDATKKGMIDTIESKESKGRGAKGLTTLYSDLASQISAVLATRKAIGQDGPPSAIYLTGNKWHPNVDVFKIEAFGMKDYNSSDVIVQYGDTYYGISLKKKPYESSHSPPLINSSFGSFLKPTELKSLLARVNDARLQFFAKIIYDACQDNTPNSPFWVQELNGGQGGTILECRKMYDFKEGKGKSIKTGQFNIQGIQLQRNGKLSTTDAKRILDIRVNVYKPTGKDGNWKLEKTPIPLINIKDTEHMDSLNVQFPIEFRTRFRDYVNRKLSSRGGEISELWREFDNIMNDNTPAELGANPRSVKRILADSILSRTLKLDLYKELDKFAAPKFEFFLVEGVGKATDDPKSDQFKSNIGTSVVKSLKSVIATIADLCPLDQCGVEVVRIDASESKAALEYKLVITPPASTGLKKVDVLHIDLRYSGSFTSYPRFHATMTPEFMQLAKGK